MEEEEEKKKKINDSYRRGVQPYLLHILLISQYERFCNTTQQLTRLARRLMTYLSQIRAVHRCLQSHYLGFKLFDQLIGRGGGKNQ